MRTAMLAVVTSILLMATASAQVPVCGNGVVEAPELCDDANLVSGDGCDANCTPTGCGNGVVTTGEQCDDGNLLAGDCCSPLCANENLPPDCSAAFASLGELWPPNHKLAPVTIGGVTDPDGDPLVLTVTAIAQDEPLDATGDGATCPDGVGVGLDAVSLRSERSGQGDGRVYHVVFQAVDVCGAPCVGEVSVCVRHDRRPNGTCGDGGPLYDSTAGAPPCEGDACDPTDCVPDPDDVDACDGDAVPAGVTARLDRAEKLLGKGKGKGRGRAAAKQLDKAARRAARAARKGDLSAGCAAALAAALDGADDCAVCSAQ
jgi:cysteine-rich repeat protein